jgi:hypothetical protein
VIAIDAVYAAPCLIVLFPAVPTYIVSVVVGIHVVLVVGVSAIHTAYGVVVITAWTVCAVVVVAYYVMVKHESAAMTTLYSRGFRAIRAYIYGVPMRGRGGDCVVHVYELVTYGATRIHRLITLMAYHVAAIVLDTLVTIALIA